MKQLFLAHISGTEVAIDAWFSRNSTGPLLPAVTMHRLKYASVVFGLTQFPVIAGFMSSVRECNRKLCNL